MTCPVLGSKTSSLGTSGCLRVSARCVGAASVAMGPCPGRPIRQHGVGSHNGQDASFTDIFGPELRARSDELPHQSYALRVIAHVELDTTSTHIVLGPA